MFSLDVLFINTDKSAIVKPKPTTVAYEHTDKKMDSVYSKRIKAGKRRTYFFDVRATRGNDYFLTITESRKRFNEDGYDRHKIFLYKEDFEKFSEALQESVDFIFQNSPAEIEHEGQQGIDASTDSYNDLSFDDLDNVK